MNRSRDCRSADVNAGRADTNTRTQPLAGGPTCTLPVRAQQSFRLRLRTATPPAEIEPLPDWDDLVQEHEGPALRKYLPDKKAHPRAVRDRQ